MSNFHKRLFVAKTLLSIFIGLTFSGSLLASSMIHHQHQHDHSVQQGHNVQSNHHIHPKIQVAILLDTSNSMDGLIDQTRNQLWDAVEELSKSKKSGVRPSLEVSVYEYGNSNISALNHYVRQVVGFTSDLDKVSEALFSLKTEGGDEFCGKAIDMAVNFLPWSQSDNDLKVIFVAGNESFTQGPTPYYQAINHAKSHSITVNTIFAGPYDKGGNLGWREGAHIAGGDYMSINQDYHVAHIVTPQDQRIATLNSQLNKTYVPYGEQGQVSAQRQIDQDANSSGISLGLLASRVKAKISSAYTTEKWDLVDAVGKGEVTLGSVTPQSLPSVMSDMNEDAKISYIQEKKTKRDALKAEINALSIQREEFIANNKSAKPDESTFGKAFSSAIQKQGEAKNFEFH